MNESTIHQQQAAITKYNQARICDLLQWHINKYLLNIFEAGHAYLDAYFNNDKEAAKALARQKQFWNWWKGLWNARDEAFIEKMDGRENRATLRNRVEYYNAIHNPAVIASESFPPRQAYPAGFTHIKMEMA